MLDITERLQLQASDLPPRLADAARFVAGHAFDAATKPMRVLANQAGHSPTTFTRLAQVMGYPGWEGLKEEFVQLARDARKRTPYSTRPLPESQSLTGDMLAADVAAIGAIDTEALALAAAMLEKAPRVFVAGFRGCYGPAALFHYLYRLFRPDVTLLGAGGHPLDIEVGAFKRTDAILLISFEPYSRDILLTARSARAAGCAIIAAVDDAKAPVARDAGLVLRHSTASPGFFPSLTACVSLLQALAGLLYVRSGHDSRVALRRTEARIQAHAAYGASRQPDS